MLLRRAIGFFSKTAKRSLEAAGGGRRWADTRESRDTSSLTHAGASLIAMRAAAAVLNNPHMAKIADVHPSNNIGTGIIPKSQVSHEAMRKRLQDNWTAWTDDAVADGSTDFYGLQYQLFRDMVVIGEALAIVELDEHTLVPRLRRLHGEQLDRSKTQQWDGVRRIEQGVEIDGHGRKVAYWIRPSAPGGSLAGLPLASIRYPASDIIHMFRPLFPGQVRGLSWFAPVLLSAKDMRDLIDAMLVRAKVSALFVGSIHDPNGTAGGFDGVQTGSALDTTVEPGAIRVENDGSRLEWNDPPQAGDTIAFSNAILRMLAVGTGVTYEQLTGDYSQVTYTSSRAALLEFRRFCESIQHHVVVFQLCRPVWQKFIQYQVLQGVIPAVDYARNRAAYHAVKWLPPAWPWVDPLKDAQAAIAEMGANVRSRSEIVAERGYDIETLDAEIAADRARAERLGIVNAAPAPQIAEENDDAAA
jgi:lambda family phage portal protein